MAVLSLATSETWRDKQTGEQKERTEWHRVVIFGKLAEIAGEYLRKGSQVYLEGQLRTRKWFDKTNGQDRYSTEVVISQQGTMQMLGGCGQSEPSRSSDRGQSQPSSSVPSRGSEPPIDFDDLIPF